jgi:hypothetical protein
MNSSEDGRVANWKERVALCSRVRGGERSALRCTHLSPHCLASERAREAGAARPRTEEPTLGLSGYAGSRLASKEGRALEQVLARRTA